MRSTRSAMVATVRRRCAGALGLACVLLLLMALTAPARAVDVQRVVGGGVEAWLVEDHTNPVIAVSLAIRDGGSASDPAGKAGLARMVAALLDEGAGDLDSAAFHSRLEELAVALRFTARIDTLEGSLRTLSAHRDEAFALVRLALTEPRFDADAVERVRRQLLAALRQDEQNPGDRAAAALAARLFPGHPYGRDANGVVADVEAITVADLRRHVTERIAKDALILGVVGDISAADLQRLLEATFAPFAESAAAIAISRAEPAADGGLTVVKLPVPQSTVLFGHGGPDRDHADFYAARVLNHILGGGRFTSRLFREVREERGLVYSIATWLAPRQHGSLWQGFAASANDRVAATVALIRDEWRRIATEGVTDAEVEAAKTFLTGSFPLRFTASDRIAEILVAMQRDRLGIDYLERHNALIEAVTTDDVRRVARQFLAPDRLTVVIAGQPEGLDASN